MGSKKKHSDAVLLGMENSAISVLSRAVEHDKHKRYAPALACYQEGIQLFLDVIIHTDNTAKCGLLRTKATEYISRAEKIKEFIQKEKELENYHGQIQIADQATGFSYDIIFKKYLDDTVTEIEVDDPYIRVTHQTYNFLHFCEVVVKGCSKLKRIFLTTGVSDNEQSSQNNRFQDIKNSLRDYDVELIVNYSSTLHDREIRFDNGWIIKIGRGLDLFKPCKKFALGFCDQSFRQCHETTIDIFYRNK